MKDDNHQCLGAFIAPHVLCYSIVYRDPKRTPNNELDDWYSCISDRIPAKEFTTIMHNCTAMVDHRSLNRIRARQAIRAAKQQQQQQQIPQPTSWGSFLKNFFVAVTTAFNRNRSGYELPTTEDNLDYRCYASFIDDNSSNTLVNNSLPTILQCDPKKDLHIYIMCAIDT